MGKRALTSPPQREAAEEGGHATDSVVPMPKTRSVA